MVHFEQRGEIAILAIDHPPVNSVSAEVASSLSAAMDRISEDPGLQAAVIIGSGSTFIAGADIKMLSLVIEGTQPLPDLNGFLFKIERSTKPVIMAIHGSALGGGLEMAMAGHYRLAAPDARLGQPEIKLGLIPGMGGTQRLPRLAGLEKALQMCVLGETISAHEALHCGLVDRIVEGDLLRGALEFAQSVLGATPPPTAARPCEAQLDLFAPWRAEARKHKRGQDAPLLAIDAIEGATRLPFDEGFALEQQLFTQCLRSGQAAAMVHLFFGERTVSKIPGLREDTAARQIKRAAVVGAGFMGTGIAMALANAEIPVLLKDVSEEALQRGVDTIQAAYRRAAERGRIAQSHAQQCLARIKPQLTFDCFDQADLIVEAVFESLPAKQQVFSQIANVANSDCLLATNTSTLDVDAIGAATRRPENVVGLHFFSPAQVMRLLEVVRASQTSDDVIATAMALGKRLGKVAVLSRNAFGFIGNRMVMPYLREAHCLVEEGASVEQVNRVLYDFGMAMGPLAMEDLVGLDVTYLMRQEQRRRMPITSPQPIIADRLYEAHRFGQKTGAGWSRYNDGRQPSSDPAIAQIVGAPRRKVPDHEILDRCLGALIEEGRQLLKEGVALRPVDVDVVYVHGYGFPAWRGGPMFYAESRSRQP